MERIWSGIAVGQPLAAGALSAPGAQEQVPFASRGIGVAEQEAPSAETGR